MVPARERHEALALCTDLLFVLRLLYLQVNYILDVRMNEASIDVCVCM